MKRILASALVAALLPLSAFAAVYNFSVTKLGSTPTTNNAYLTSLSHGWATTWGLNNGTYTSLFNDINTSGLVVTSATLTLTNIRDWTGESQDPADALFVNILGGLDTGLKTKRFDYTNTDSSTWSQVRNPFLDDTVNTGTADWNQVLQNSTALNFQDAVAGSLLKSTDADQAWTTGAGAVPASVTWSDRSGGSTSAYASTVVINFNAANLSVLRTLIDLDPGTGSPNVGLGFAAECHYFMDTVSLSITTGSASSVPDTGNTLALMGLGMAAMMGFRRVRK